MTPRVVVLVGLPGSGKSTWLEKQGTGGALSSDGLRNLLSDDVNNQSIHRQVFATLRYLLRRRLELGCAVTHIDATNLARWERRPYILTAELWGAEAEAIFFDVPLDVCRERNRSRSRVVPDEILVQMAGRLDPPDESEGFRRVRRVGVDGVCVGNGEQS